MKKIWAVLALGLALTVAARATPIVGTLAFAGLNTYNSTSITFTNPGTVLQATGTFMPMLTVPQIDLTSGPFASAVGETLFDWNHGGDNIDATVLTLTVLQNDPHFLNLSGVLRITATGFTTTDFGFTLTSTRPDGSTSYTADVVALSPVPEPGTLALLGTGLLGLSFVVLWRGRKRALRALPVLLALAAAPLARATPITGDLAVAGINTFNSSSITFLGPAPILGANGSLAVMLGTPTLTMQNFTFPGSAGFMLFDWNHGGTDISFSLLTGTVLQNTGQFLNIEGTGTMMETGFDNTVYDWTLTSTKSGTTSYALNLAPVAAAVIPEPGTFLLLATGLALIVSFLRRKEVKIK